MNNDAMNSNLADNLRNIVAELQFLAAKCVSCNDLAGIEKELLSLSTNPVKLIIFLTYLFQNCKEHQAKTVSYLAKEFSTHTHKNTNQHLFIEEYFMWMEFGSERCVQDLYRRVEQARGVGKVNDYFTLP